MARLGFNVGSTVSLGDMSIALDFLGNQELYQPDLEEIQLFDFGGLKLKKKEQEKTVEDILREYEEESLQAEEVSPNTETATIVNTPAIVGAPVQARMVTTAPPMIKAPLNSMQPPLKAVHSAPVVVQRQPVEKPVEQSVEQSVSKPQPIQQNQPPQMTIDEQIAHEEKLLKLDELKAKRARFNQETLATEPAKQVETAVKQPVIQPAMGVTVNKASEVINIINNKENRGTERASDTVRETQRVAPQARPVVNETPKEKPPARPVVNEAQRRMEEPVRVNNTQRYSDMDIECLYKHVKKFMLEHNVKKCAVDKKLLEQQFGFDNVKKLLLKSYIILIGKGVTIGR